MRTLALIALGLPLILPGAAAGEPAPSGVGLDSPQISFLRQIEERALPLPLVIGPPRHESLAEYYWESNIPLRTRLNEALRAFDSGKPTVYRAMTIVSGTAGIGKTFIKRNVYSDEIPGERVWKFDIRELLSDWAQRGLAQPKSDLCHGDRVINRLLALTPQGRTEFAQLLNSKSPAFVVVDSLDEIHPDEYHFVLSALEHFALHGNCDFVHVVVFGRPLAFRDYVFQRQIEGMPQGLQVHVLQPPEFRTTGDLRVSSWNYDCWKHRLSRTGRSGQSVPMSFAEYQRWCDQGLSVDGPFADVTCSDPGSYRPQVHQELLRWSTNHRVVDSVLSNLAANSIVRDIVQGHVERGEQFNERRFMNEFLAKWLERDTRSDDRPSRIKPEFLDLYLRLLEAVSAKYVDQQRVSRLGYFDVEDEDRVTVQHGEEIVSVHIRTVLDRSGLVTLDPLLHSSRRYRFEPVWLHRLLFQMHLERDVRQRSHPQPIALVRDAGDSPSAAER